MDVVQTTLRQSMEEAWIVRAEDAIEILDTADRAHALFTPETRDQAARDFAHARREIARWER